MSSIQNLRLAKNYTQEQLAKILGVERSTIAKWETGQSMPRTELLIRVADTLDCSIDDLLRHTAKVGGEG